MPPTREDLRRAFERHLECWNKPDREGWIALFDPQVQFDDPVGVPTKHGLEAAARQWDSSFVDGQRWQLHHRLIYYRGGIACVVKLGADRRQIPNSRRSRSGRSGTTDSSACAATAIRRPRWTRISRCRPETYAPNHKPSHREVGWNRSYEAPNNVEAAVRLLAREPGAKVLSVLA
jgi:hypothetical protein